jgi:hypothetical protein
MSAVPLIGDMLLNHVVKHPQEGEINRTISGSWRLRFGLLRLAQAEGCGGWLGCPMAAYDFGWLWEQLGLGDQRER